VEFQFHCVTSKVTNQRRHQAAVIALHFKAVATPLNKGNVVRNQDTGPTVRRICLKCEVVRPYRDSEWSRIENILTASVISITIGCRHVIGVNALNGIPDLERFRDKSAIIAEIHKFRADGDISNLGSDLHRNDACEAGRHDVADGSAADDQEPVHSRQHNRSSLFTESSFWSLRQRPTGSSGESSLSLMGCHCKAMICKSLKSTLPSPLTSPA